jgi:hypothetical protein
MPVLILWCEKVLQNKAAQKIMPGVRAGSEARCVAIWVYPRLARRQKGYAVAAVVAFLSRVRLLETKGN